MAKPAASVPWALTAGGLTLVVRLTPKGGRDSIDGMEQRSDGQCVLKARVRAAPTEGEANDALVTLIAILLVLPSGLVGLWQRRR